MIARLARLVKRCQELPGQELFQYVDDDGEVRDVASDDVNAYLREASGGGFTAKDFRTWAGTLLAFRALSSLGPADSTTASRKNVLHAIRQVADGLGNTPTVARGSYVHPAVVDAYLEGSLRGALLEATEEEATPPERPTPEEEQAMVALLRRRQREQQRELRQRGGGTSRRPELGRVRPVSARQPSARDPNERLNRRAAADPRGGATPMRPTPRAAETSSG